MVAIVLGSIGILAFERIAGLTTMMYAIVANVVTPPRNSWRSELPCARMANQRSRKVSMISRSSARSASKAARRLAPCLRSGLAKKHNPILHWQESFVRGYHEGVGEEMERFPPAPLEKRGMDTNAKPSDAIEAKLGLW